MITTTAEELPLNTVGKVIGVAPYINKNKTARRLPYREYRVRDLHMYPRGNIVINSGEAYLKPDTVVYVFEDGDPHQLTHI